MQVANHVLFAEPDNAEARRLQADALEQLGYGSENGTWRNFYLTGALELRDGSIGTPTVAAAPDLLGALTLGQLMDALAAGVNGPRSWKATLTVRWVLPDAEPITMLLRNGVLTHFSGPSPEVAEPDVEIALAEPDLRLVLLGGADPALLASQGRVEITGDPSKLAELMGYPDEPDPDFAIVTP